MKYTARDESGFRVHIAAPTGIAAAEHYVTFGDYSNSTAGYVDVTVEWTVDGVEDHETFCVPIPGWTGCASG